jgi:hypothetical protein
MNIEQIYSYLCVYDSRHPDYQSLVEASQSRKEGYCCGNCFWKRDSLALEILRLHEIINSSNKCFNI